jgi:hypothetical protein
MKRAARKNKVELWCRVGPVWDGDVNKLAKSNVVPDGYELAEVKRAGCKFTFVYLKSIPRNPK